ncbi:MAG: DoxX family protein [Paludibacter sp.]|nr:DoxX family protein [Bacteroidales bacterium]MCM1068363.1 DoxX family protein [Prevotella sp.]MCM1354009.1 DoxX family protein [Bacteroides sp.]MCM1442149.1 DoxX family protein [Muribaculum sp.]MCM1481958.1 DoxX family protein [Paludibacter sp.]
MKQNKLLHIIGSVTRTLLALVFIFSGFVKAVDPLGTTYKIEDYLTAFGSFFSVFIPLAEPMAWVLIGIEFLLGIALLCNLRTKLTSWFTLCFMCFMTPLTLYIAISNPVSDCGCFGDAVVLSNWATFWKNIVLLALVIVLLCTKKHIPQTFTNKAELAISMLAIGLVTGIMLWSRLHLPFIDFRPYKTGNNLPELMEYPEDAQPDVYDITFVYAQNGVEQEFTLQDYPRNDSTWVFVRQNTRLISKGYEPPIHDFTITDEEFEDLTYDILESEQPVVLVVMYDLAKTSRTQAKKLNRLYRETLAAGRSFYALTGSGTADIEVFRDEMQAEYPFCNTDPVTLKTIVRANPGVIVLQNGTVIEKYNLRNK